MRKSFDLKFSNGLDKENKRRELQLSCYDQKAFNKTYYLFHIKIFMAESFLNIVDKISLRSISNKYIIVKHKSFPLKSENFSQCSKIHKKKKIAINIRKEN